MENFQITFFSTEKKEKINPCGSMEQVPEGIIELFLSL